MNFFICTLTFLGVFLAGLRYGLQPALWWGWFAGLLLIPVWFKLSVGTIILDPRAVVSLAVIAVFLTQPIRFPSFRPLLSDVLFVGMVGTIIVAQYLNDDLRLGSPFEAARFWFLPYLMGRWFVQNPSDLGSITRVAVWACLGVSVYAILESVTMINPWKSLFDRLGGEDYRWGIKRAQVGLHHPIYLGLLLVLVMPWLIEAFRRARQGLGPSWWRLTPGLLGCAIFCTASRGALIALVCSLAWYAIFRLVWARSVLLIVFMIVGGLAFSFKDDLVRFAEGLSGNSPTLTVIVQIRGESFEYSGTRHRLLLAKVYQEPLEQAGWFGYGTNLRRQISLPPETDERFVSIDQHYIHLRLQYGAVGVAMFVAIGIIGLVYLVQLAWQWNTPSAPMAAGLFGALFGVLLMLNGVWLPTDLAAGFFFCIGLGASMRQLQQQSLRLPTPQQTTSTLNGSLRDLSSHPAWQSEQNRRD